jgi:toxin ParE1/3/4
MRNYKLSRRADLDLIDIYSYGFEQFGELQADRYHKRLEDCFRLLAGQAGLGRRYDISGQDVQVFFHENCVIIYQIAGSHILIARVLSMRQNWQHLLRSPLI